MNIHRWFILPRSQLRWWIAPLAALMFILILGGLTTLGLKSTWGEIAKLLLFVVLATGLPWLLLRPRSLAHLGLAILPGTVWRTVAITVFGVLLLKAWSAYFVSSGDDAAQSLEQVLRSFGFGQNSGHDVALVLLIVVFAPLGEEALFRVLLFRSLYDGLRRYAWAQSPWAAALCLLVALLLSAFLFADSHGGGGQDAQFGALFVMGLIFALLYLWAGNLWAPVMAHSIHNAWALAAETGLLLQLKLSPAALVLVYVGPLLALLLLWLWRRSLGRCL
ncbi:CPBP family intramembrane glutamic endopeptidase [Paralysiella testudinis]|uniref:CPBP family intramembrane metalloprotease n=1 Tax=Paralysiella testudinis TaxID=2809020 RepID=A0A892ZKS1_9NEIS|nr:CPBP family intramembrane glutamic endopeptidase [Paralysiella testudinis]QRQ82286.1 CPBP family intramembrane metalloprotease [Paralysiella testudinis]